MWLAFHLNHDKMKCKILCSEVKCYIFAFYMNCPLCLKLLFPQYHKFVFADLVISILGFKILGPVVQSVVSLTSSLRVISLTVLADSKHNILIFFAEKM